MYISALIQYAAHMCKDFCMTVVHELVLTHVSYFLCLRWQFCYIRYVKKLYLLTDLLAYYICFFDLPHGRSFTIVHSYLIVVHMNSKTNST